MWHFSPSQSEKITKKGMRLFSLPRERRQRRRGLENWSLLWFTQVLKLCQFEQLSRTHGARCSVRAQDVLTAHYTPLSKGLRRDRIVPVLNLCLSILVSSQKTTEKGLRASQDVLLHFDFFKHAALILCSYAVTTASAVHREACHLTDL